MSTPTKTDQQLITDAVGAHGVFFKKALRTELEKISGVRILGEEYPVRYMEGASVDLLIQFSFANSTFVLPIECKRALDTMKKWIFFRDAEKNIKFLYSFSGSSLSVSQSDVVTLGGDICSEGIEIDVTKLRGGTKSPYSAASADSIWGAAFQACKGGLGFLQAELKARASSTPQSSDFHAFFLVVTTAPLQVADLPDGSIDAISGAHIGELRVKDVPWLILHYPFAPSSSLGSNHLEVSVDGYTDPASRGMLGKEGILILNAQHVGQFFNALSGEPAVVARG